MEMELSKVEWREKMCELLSKIEDNEKLIALRDIASVIKEMLRNDERFIQRMQLVFRYGNEDVAIDIYYRDILLGRIRLSLNTTLEELRKELIENRMSFATELLIDLVTEFQYICSTAYTMHETEKLEEDP
jgi:hypothetical protein